MSKVKSFYEELKNIAKDFDEKEKEGAHPILELVIAEHLIAQEPNFENLTEDEQEAYILSNLIQLVTQTEKELAKTDQTLESHQNDTIYKTFKIAEQAAMESLLKFNERGDAVENSIPTLKATQEFLQTFVFNSQDPEINKKNFKKFSEKINFNIDSENIEKIVQSKITQVEEFTKQKQTARQSHAINDTLKFISSNIFSVAAIASSFLIQPSDALPLEREKRGERETKPPAKPTTVLPGTTTASTSPTTTIETTESIVSTITSSLSSFFTSTTQPTTTTVATEDDPTDLTPLWIALGSALVLGACCCAYAKRNNPKVSAQQESNARPAKTNPKIVWEELTTETSTEESTVNTSTPIQETGGGYYTKTTHNQPSSSTTGSINATNLGRSSETYIIE